MCNACIATYAIDATAKGEFYVHTWVTALALPTSNTPIINEHHGLPADVEPAYGTKRIYVQATGEPEGTGRVRLRREDDADWTDWIDTSDVAGTLGNLGLDVRLDACRGKIVLWALGHVTTEQAILHVRDSVPMSRVKASRVMPTKQILASWRRSAVQLLLRTEKDFPQLSCLRVVKGRRYWRGAEVSAEHTSLPIRVVARRYKYRGNKSMRSHTHLSVFYKNRRFWAGTLPRAKLLVNAFLALEKEP